jgi:hypothetical protein
MESALSLLEAAFAEVAASPESMRKLGRTACMRATLEREWVYEIDNTVALSRARVTREVPLKGGRADLSIDGTMVDFKSTKPWYAVQKYFQTTTPPKRDSVEGRFGGDMKRMEENDGIFVLLVSTAGVVTNSEYGQMSSVEDMRTEACGGMSSG